MGGCISCLGSSERDEKSDYGVKEAVKNESFKEGSVAQSNRVSSDKSKPWNSNVPKKEAMFPKEPTAHNIAAQTFMFRELAAATENFRPESLIGEGGFGRVYKGQLESTGQVVAVKQLDRNGLQGNREFLVEVLMLSLLHHSNLVNLIGYCADGDQRLLVYEYMPLGSLEDHLHDLPPNRKPLDWNTRMKIAAGAAKGLEYLHDKANPPVIYRDLKSSNILLDEDFFPKLSDFGLAKLGPVGDKTHVSTRVMGTYGYCAPEYAMTGQLTLRSDVYSFGVVLLELITGRKAIDSTRGPGEQTLVAWSRPLFKDRRKFPKMADPLLQGQYPIRGLYQAIAVAAMCLQEQAATRPLIGDVVTALAYLASQTYDPSNASSAQNNKVDSSTPRHKKNSGRRNPSDGSDNLDESSVRGSPDLRKQDHFRNNKVGPSTPRHKHGGHRNRSDGSDNLDELSIRGSPSPDLRKRDHFREKTSSLVELPRIYTKGSSHPDSRRDSPVSGGRQRVETPRNHRGSERERAVAEAKVWGENWRERKNVNGF